MGSPQQGLSKWSNVLHTVVVTATRPSPTSRGRSRPLVARSPFTTCPRSTAHQSAATATLPSREYVSPHLKMCLARLCEIYLQLPQLQHDVVQLSCRMPEPFRTRIHPQECAILPIPFSPVACVRRQINVCHVTPQLELHSIQDPPAFCSLTII